MSVIQANTVVKLRITEDHYLDSPPEYEYENYSLHDAIPRAILDQLKEEKPPYNLLGLEKPNRLITEGEDTESWQNTEDWAITSSEEGGKLAIGQTVSHRENKELYGGIPYEVIQAWSFEDRIRSVQSRAYDHTSGVYTVSIDYQRDSVRQLEKQAQSAIEEKGFVEIEAIVCELDRSEPKQLNQAFSILNSD